MVYPKTVTKPEQFKSSHKRIPVSDSQRIDLIERLLFLSSSLDGALIQYYSAPFRTIQLLWSTGIDPCMELQASLPVLERFRGNRV